MTSLETSDEDYRDPEPYFRTADAAFEAICSVQLCIGHVAVKTRSHGRGKHSFDTHIDVRCQNSGKYQLYIIKKGLYKTSPLNTIVTIMLAKLFFCSGTKWIFLGRYIFVCEGTIPIGYSSIWSELLLKEARLCMRVHDSPVRVYGLQMDGTDGSEQLRFEETASTPKSCTYNCRPLLLPDPCATFVTGKEQ